MGLIVDPVPVDPIPFEPICEDIIPSLCGNKYTPMMDYTYECSECMPRPYGKCLDEMLIPDVCDLRCEDVWEHEEEQVALIQLELTLNNSPSQAGDIIDKTFTATNVGNVPIYNFRIINGSLETVLTDAVLDVGETVSVNDSSVLIQDSVNRGYVILVCSATGMANGEEIWVHDDMRYDF